MLPPVTATIGSDVTFSNLPAQQLAAAQASVVGKNTPNDSNQTPASLFAKANLASLSSQLQVAQNVTVLADAIGKLMNLPKLDGETARNYVVRLVTALQDMPPVQRSALEAQISKILPGLTLSILTETLKNPTGPQAARLAMLLETAVHKDSDLAAKAVVSSYRQNIGADARGAPQQGLIAQSTQQAAQASTTAAAGRTVPLTSAQTPINQQTANTAAAPSSTSTQPAAAPSMRPSGVAEQTTATSPKPAAGQAAPTAGGIASQAPATSNAQISQAQPLPIRGTGLAQPPIHAEAGTKTPVSSEQPLLTATTKPVARASVELPVANARALELRARFEQTSRMAPAAANDTATATKDIATLAKEATAIAPNPVAALINAISTSRLPSAADANQSLFASLIGMVKSSIKDLSFNQTAASSIQQTSEIDAILDQLKGLGKSEIQAKLLEAIRHMPPDHPQVQALLMSALRSELGPVQPYINYPAADDEFESESYPRGQWSSSSGEQHHEDDAEGETNADDEAIEFSTLEEPELAPADFPLSEDEPTERHAENYYLRMGNFL